MNFQPDITDVLLEECCIKAIKDIREIIRNGKLLNKILPTGVLVNIFVSPYRGSSGLLSTSLSAVNTDWELLAKATMSLGKLTKERCRHVAGLEMFKHNSKFNKQLKEFWEGVYEAFS